MPSGSIDEFGIYSPKEISATPDGHPGRPDTVTFPTQFDAGSYLPSDQEISPIKGYNYLYDPFLTLIIQGQYILSYPETAAREDEFVNLDPERWTDRVIDAQITDSRENSGSSFEVTIANPSERLQDDDLLRMGAVAAIEWGYRTWGASNHRVGVLIEAEPQIGRSGSTLKLRFMDLGGSLIVTSDPQTITGSKSWTPYQIAQWIVENRHPHLRFEAPAPPPDLSPVNSERDYQIADGQNDMTALRQLAGQMSTRSAPDPWDVFVHHDVVHFKPRKLHNRPAIGFLWRSDPRGALIDFRASVRDRSEREVSADLNIDPRTGVTNLANSVNLSGDLTLNENVPLEIEGVNLAEDVENLDNAEDLEDAVENLDLTLSTDTGLSSGPEDASPRGLVAHARQLANQNKIVVHITSIGLPQVELLKEVRTVENVSTGDQEDDSGLGMIVALSGLGDLYSGLYELWEVDHMINAQGYTCRMKLHSDSTLAPVSRWFRKSSSPNPFDISDVVWLNLGVWPWVPVPIPLPNLDDLKVGDLNGS